MSTCLRHPKGGYVTDVIFTLSDDVCETLDDGLRAWVRRGLLSSGSVARGLCEKEISLTLRSGHKQGRWNVDQRTKNSRVRARELVN